MMTSEIMKFFFHQQLTLYPRKCTLQQEVCITTVKWKNNFPIKGCIKAVTDSNPVGPILCPWLGEMPIITPFKIIYKALQAPSFSQITMQYTFNITDSSCMQGGVSNMSLVNSLTPLRETFCSSVITMCHTCLEAHGFVSCLRPAKCCL